MSPLVRLAQLQDIPQLIAIERSAAQLFLQQPAWRFLADGPVMSRQQHADFIQQQQEWVAESASGEVAGFIAVLPQQQDWHIAELSVAADWQRRGIGRRLIAEVAMQAKSQGAQRLTLTTFIDVPWNAPYYRRLGFQPIAAVRLNLPLRQRLAEEAAQGFVVGSRCAMEFTLS
ncbi:GNAT family N-acetyltransferase [Serratia plymuthica]|uniref:GNAT family N-acetyltransferase n=1 Tax=Serratia plymuthica TaxID=82996 RepID=A0A2X4TYT4_SERPL|nr:GNAT family N-acetyltransferase [Serratia plymuthica]QPS22228.1 GNAT family N-acetyltransferase [Serratia plymuthica]QPS63839.1 GNAT family N-acetyltransferase [Serratia plymuthica]RKS63776.1 putative N-acetyltransferase YhbS [Serratia plymuthica]CAI2481713.1 N-acetylglutamate synthase [Serratia plymuthica]SQI32637.1 N-acetylglutamate synthase [Serratia plymuthica]